MDTGGLPWMLPVIGALERGDIKLAHPEHPEHRLHGALGASGVIAEISEPSTEGTICQDTP